MMGSTSSWGGARAVVVGGDGNWTKVEGSFCYLHDRFFGRRVPGKRFSPSAKCLD